VKSEKWLPAVPIPEIAISPFGKKTKLEILSILFLD